MTDFLLTILFAGIVGFIFLKLKVPGGMMVGAIFGAAILNLGFGHAYMPYEMKVVAQMISGAFIAVGIDRNDLKNIKRLAKPLIILVSCMLVLNMISGFVIYNFSTQSQSGHSEPFFVAEHPWHSPMFSSVQPFRFKSSSCNSRHQRAETSHSGGALSDILTHKKHER